VKGNARITVVENIYHQTSEGEPFQIECGFTRKTEVIEQPYVRWLTATEEWQLLDMGWMKDVTGMLIIVNQDDQNTLELGHQPWFIPPGESFRGTTQLGNDVPIRSSVGKIRFTLYCLPK